MKVITLLPAVALSLAFICPAPAADPVTDRAAVERVYHTRRTGTTQSFEDAVPRPLIGNLVSMDQRREAVLKSVYGMEITRAMVAAEVERINTTTRAPEVLREMKHSLDDDPARFADAVARPLIVERELRARFDNDARLHAAQRAEAEKARADLLAGRTVANMRDVTWQLAPRPADDQPAAPATLAVPAQANGKSTAYTNEATARITQTLTSPVRPEPDRDRLYFDDLAPEVQKVIRTRLEKPGDVSAVIEMSGGFLVFQAKAKTVGTLRVSSLTIPKRSYEEWLAAQPSSKP